MQWRRSSGRGVTEIVRGVRVCDMFIARPWEDYVGKKLLG
jgi:hypothetical protein